jgi:ABC-type transporter Mla subunit MlaD
MEAFLALVGMLFFMFFVLSAVVELVMEVFRGVFEFFGVPLAKSKVSLDDALALSKEFAPDNKDLSTRISALYMTAEQLSERAKEKITALDDLKTNLNKAAGTHSITREDLNNIALSIKKELNQNTRLRTFIMRGFALLIGCVLCALSDFYVFKILESAPEGKELLTTLPMLKDDWLNIIVGGFAAAAGSSYWHDQLDRIRNLKSASGNIKVLKA